MIEFRYSGGASNSNPSLSIGGVISSVSLTQKTATYATTALSGVSILNSSNNTPDTTASSISATISLKTVSNGIVVCFGPCGYSDPFYLGDSNWALIQIDGSYDLVWSKDGLVCSITVSTQKSLLPSAVLSGGTDYRPISIPSSTSGNLFDTLKSEDFIFGGSDYKCLYIKNTLNQILYCKMYIAERAVSSVISCGLDLSSNGGTAELVANENTAPSGVTFSNPDSTLNSIQFTISSLSHQAIWLRRQYNILCLSDISSDEIPLMIEVG